MARSGPIVINDRIAECDDGKERRIDVEALDKTILHRISFAADDGGGHFDDVSPIPDAGLDGPKMAKRFHDTRRVRGTGTHWADRPGTYTAGQTPYALLLRTNGQVDQCTALGDFTPHARRWSERGISLAIVGDFRNHKPTPQQWSTAVELCALLHAWGAPPVGHTELPRSTKDPDKLCPGDRYWSMPTFRLEVELHTYAKISRFAAEQMLREVLGVVF